MVKKYKRNGELKDVSLEVDGWGLSQVNYISGATMATYYYHFIESISPISDAPGSFVLRYGKSDTRTHMFHCGSGSDLSSLLSKAQAAAQSTIGIALPLSDASKAPTKESVIQSLRNAEDESIFNTLAEFHVQKISPARHVDPAPRLITLSDKWLVERNPSTYAVVTMRPLESIDQLERPASDPQGFVVVYRDGTRSSYTSTARDSLLACLLDCTRATGSREIVIVGGAVPRSLRLTPVGVPIESAAEEQLLTSLATYSFESHSGEKDKGLAGFMELLRVFNANVPYSGLRFVETTRSHKQVAAALSNVLALAALKPQTAVFHAVHRLLGVRTAFEAFTDNEEFQKRFLMLLKGALGGQCSDEVLVCGALDVLLRLMIPAFNLPPQNPNTTDSSNKRIIMADSGLMDGLLNLFAGHVRRDTAPLVVMGCVEVLTTMLCPPYGDTTDEAQFNALLERVAGLGRDFFKLFHQSYCLSVVRGAGMIMKVIVEEGSAIRDLVPKMQLSALVEGATLRHLHTALFSKLDTQRQILFRLQSRELVALWVSGCKEAEAMLERAVPPALLYYLRSKDEAPEGGDDDEIAAAMKSGLVSAGRNSGDDAGKKRKNAIVNAWASWRAPNFPKRPPSELRLRNIEWSGSDLNWKMFFYQIRQDHLRADLVWNNHTREELREALENELRIFRQEQELAADGYISWNHLEFLVPYDCLYRELNVGGYYLRLLLNPQPGQKAPVLRNPAEFFDMLFHRALLEDEGELQALCIQALAVVYKYYHKDIGPFRDVAHVVALLRKCTDRVTRDRLLLFFSVLFAVEQNAKLFVDHGGISILVDLMTLVHFNVDHVVRPIESNLITAGAERTEGEWYYSVVTPAQIGPDGVETAPAKKERFGPKNVHELRKLFADGVITPSTLCWAQGMEEWRPLNDIIQLRWPLMGTGHSIMSDIELTKLLLDMLTKLCKLYPIRDADGGIIRPIPRPKRQLSSPQLLPYVAQMLLTFDSELVEKAAVLLEILMEDNAASIPKAYLTGLFYFAVIYGGSNMLPTFRLLKRVHMQQHFRDDSDTAAIKDVAQLSILSPLLPPAMIHLLERKSAEEFTAIFLGNNDTPEAIWNVKMRNLLIDRVSTHLGNFPQRLSVNPKAIYQYVPIAPIVYKEIQAELFCAHYYLRNFCDLSRFAMWPVDDEVEFLQALLVLWTAEKDRPPPAMSDEEACNVLRLKPGEYTEAQLRRNYFRLAKEYHPDKNPEGKPIFQKITAAYNLLSTQAASGGGSGGSGGSGSSGPNRILLLVKAQSILYTRFRTELSPFKYAGYPLLLEAVKKALEADDRELLNAAAELAYCTIKSTSLNAEEMRRQDGLIVLADMLRHFSGLVMPDTKPGTVVPETLSYILLTYATAASFAKCRDTISGSTPTVAADVCYCTTLTALPKVIEGALESVCCFALDPVLSEQLISHNVLFHLIPLLFKYDYTMNVTPDKSADSGQQIAMNVHAQLALMSLARLGGLDPAVDKVPPEHAACVRALLSDGIASLLYKDNVPDLLKKLNSNIETPTLLWNQSCRNDVLTYVESRVRSSSADGIDESPLDAQNFKFRTLERELVIGGIYVRLYNEQIRAQVALPDPKRFTVNLADYIKNNVSNLVAKVLPPSKLKELRDNANDSSSSSSYSSSTDLLGIDGVDDDDQTPAERLERVENEIVRMRMAAEALRNILQTPNVDTLLAKEEYIRSIFAMLSITADQGTQSFALEAIGRLTRNAELIRSIAEAHVLGYMGAALAGPSVVSSAATQVLSSMLGNSKIVIDCLSYGAVLHLLDIVATPLDHGVDPAPRINAFAVLAKMSTDLVHGSRIRIALGKFLPGVMIATAKQDPEAAVSMFDSVQENPELIWTPSTREQLRSTLDGMAHDLYARQIADPSARWDLPDDYRLVYSEMEDQCEIGGVYLNIFLKQPSWALQNPKAFLEAMLTRYVDLYTQSASSPADQEMMENIVAATHALLSGTQSLCDYPAKTGHLAKIVSLMATDSISKQATANTLLAILATSPLCMETMARTQNTVYAAVATMRAVPEKAIPHGVELFSKTFGHTVCSPDACLVKQLIACEEAIPMLMDILDGKYDMKLATAAAESKAMVVSALQRAVDDSIHGPQLSDVLSKNPIWANYRGMRHDLFLPGQTVTGLLTNGPTGATGRSGGSIGLLTNTPHSAQIFSDKPPELL